jgi:transposase-like protein
MAFEEGTARLVCPACGAEHKARWSRIPVREVERISCQSCHGILLQENTIRAYFDVELCKPD